MYIYIYTCRGMFFMGGCWSFIWLMRSISSGVAGGSSLALAWKALSLIDRPADPIALCKALSRATWTGSQFFLGVTGVLFAFVELSH